jgi:hypothetical protein
MGKKIVLNLLLIVTLSQIVVAQKKDTVTSLNKLLMLQATISPGYWFNQQKWNSYFHATLEWCFDKRVSIRADGSYYFTTQNVAVPIFKMNHSLLLGAFYHYPKNKFDFYFGIQPGCAMVLQRTYKTNILGTNNDTTIVNPPLKFAPIMTAACGINYFFWKYMSIFAAVKILHGNYIPPYGKTISLDELRISAGIGWQVRFKKEGSKHNRVVGF